MATSGQERVGGVQGSVLAALAYAARAPLTLVVGAFAGLLSLLLLLPGRTFVARYSSDLIAFMDAADRSLKGQVANVDYTNVIGPLCTLLLAAGKWLGGSWGAMFPVATVIVLAAVTPLLIYVVSTRLPRVPGLIFAACILILVAAPIMLGDIPRMMTFAMFYNRWGWAILSIILIMALPGGTRWDALVIALSLAALLYIKVTFAAVGVAFIIGCAVLLPQMRKNALLSLAGLAGVVLLVELLWGGTLGYLTELRNAAGLSGAFRGGLRAFVSNSINNAVELLLLGVFAVLAAYRGVKLVYFLFALGMAVSGVLLFGQSAQLGGIVTVVPAALLLMLAPAKRRPERAEVLVFAVLAGSIAVTPAVALAWHTIAASAPVEDPRSEIAGIITPGSDDDIAMSLERMEEIYARRELEATELSSIAVFGFSEPERFYFWTLHDGVELLRKVASEGSIVVLDLANPFNALLDRQPPRGIDIAQGYGRTIGETSYPKAEVFFRDADIVMVPAFPRHTKGAELMVRVYAGYLRDHYNMVARDQFWTVYQRRGR